MNFNDWYDSNKSRKFPFGDDTLCPLDTGAVIDAELHPIDSVGTVYLSLISRTLLTLEISDSSGVIGTATLAETSIVRDKRGNNIGIIRVNTELLPDTLRLTAAQSAFAAACVFNRSTSQVRGLVLPRGEVVSGAVVIAAGSGIELAVTGQSLSLSAVGIQDEDICAVLLPPIKCVVFKTLSNSNFTLAETNGGGVLLGLRGLSLASLCQPKLLPAIDGTLPQAYDPCAEPVPAPAPDTTHVPGTTLACKGGRVALSVAATLALTALETEATGTGTLPPRSTQGLEISVRGRA